MYAVHVTVKVQNKLAKNSIILSLKQWSKYLFTADHGLVLRCFLDKSENQVEIFHVFKSKKHVEKTRRENSDNFWNEIKQMGGQVSRIEGPCEVEMSSESKNFGIEFL